ncbi:MAG: amino acid ABC transporter substrate-binding protein [Desulfobacteraceae bacterium]|nr:amino acid ABC transporter substrate-binding protein [Desulfobacteraceae bacterium]
MNNKQKIQMVLRSILILFFLFSTCCFAADTITFSLIESPPFTTDTMEKKGIEPEIVSAVFKNMGMDANYKFLPAARVYETAKAGKSAGIVGWVWSEERAKSFYYTDEIMRAPLVFFHLKTFDFGWQTMDDLKEIPIGTVLKNYYGPKFHQAADTKKISIYEIRNEKTAYKTLLGGRIKLLPVNQYVGYGSVKESFGQKAVEKITHHPRPLKTSVYHLLLSKSYPGNDALVKRFNQGLSAIKKSREYDKIIGSYNLK